MDAIILLLSDAVNEQLTLSSFFFIYLMKQTNNIYFSTRRFLVNMLFDVQAIVLKYMIFLPEELGIPPTTMPQNSVPRRSCRSENVAPDDLFDSLTEDRKSR